MKIILDANVLVSAFVAEGGTCDEVFEKCAKDHAIFISDSILAEVRRILADKIRMPGPQVEQDVAKLSELTGRVVPVTVPRGACVDRDDLHVLGAAVAAGADVIVSGDSDLLRIGSYAGIKILRPSDMLRELAERADPPPPETSPGGLKAAERGPRYGRRRKRNP